MIGICCGIFRNDGSAGTNEIRRYFVRIIPYQIPRIITIKFQTVNHAIPYDTSVDSKETEKKKEEKYTGIWLGS